MKKQFLFIFALILLTTSCLKEGQSIEKTDNPEFKLELLFKKDGCKIYRFRDCGNFIYWTDCRGKIETTYNNGKTETKVQNEITN
jgi:hypothetical protein